MSERKLDEDFAAIGSLFCDEFNGVAPGECVLISRGGKYDLVRYDGLQIQIRGSEVYASLDGPSIEFVRDEEFGIYLPSSYWGGAWILLAERDADGQVHDLHDSIQVVKGRNNIIRSMQKIVRRNILRNAIVPFIDNRPTSYRLPQWDTKAWAHLIPGMQLRYSHEARKIESGGFIYVGCKEEVFLFGVAKTQSGEVHWQGTYTASTKPPLYFTNAYLGPKEAREEKGDSAGTGLAGFLRRVVGLKKRGSSDPFVFPHIGRRQNCKYTVFTGGPQVITGDITKALEHFATTDFAEYADVVAEYAARIKEPHPTLMPVSTNGFYI